MFLLRLTSRNNLRRPSLWKIVFCLPLAASILFGCGKENTSPPPPTAAQEEKMKQDASTSLSQGMPPAQMEYIRSQQQSANKSAVKK